jgi:hypothetical protein
MGSTPRVTVGPPPRAHTDCGLTWRNAKTAHLRKPAHTQALRHERLWAHRLVIIPEPERPAGGILAIGDQPWPSDASMFVKGL